MNRQVLVYAGFALTILAAPLQAFPPSSDIGLMTIDNYAANGGGMSNLMYQIASGQNFFAGANANIPGYSSSLSGGTSGPNLAMDKRDNQVDKNTVISTSSSFGNREYNDILFYGGHGIPAGVYLGASGGYGPVTASEFNFGSGYNRWFISNACILFNTPSAPATAWQSAFKGLKAMLGFRSVVFDNNQSWELYNEFWLNWTWREKSLLNSFFDAQANYGYAHLYPSLGLEPGCLSAQVPAGRIDYCRESFRWTEKNYNKATENTGYYYNRVIGSPIY